MSIPLILKLIIFVLAVLVILLIVAIRKKKKAWARGFAILLFVTAVFGLWQGLHEYNRTNADLQDVQADVKVAAIDLIHQYETNNAAADQKYLGRVVETTGKIKKIERDEKGYYTIVLGDEGSPSSVRCSMDTVHNDDAAHLEAGSSATVRGACTGFNKDEMGLGSDVILNRCAIITKKDQ